jgi:quercetin dioxygenase-like cupin family protein
MIKNSLSEMTRGWFVGAFSPSVLFTRDVEVAVKYYKAQDVEQPHFHKVATEITVVLSGTVVMNGQRFVTGDIVTVVPGEVVYFSALEDSSTVVVKIPGVDGDKYPVLP